MPARSAKKSIKPKARRASAARVTAKSRPTKAKTQPTVKAKQPDSLTLPAECLVGDIVQFKSQLTPLLGNESAVTLDASAVTRIDTASLQLLTAFVRERRNHNRVVTWHGVTPAFTAAASRLGLESALQAVSA